MKKIISNNQPFQCLNSSFTAQLPAGTYTLSYSVDGATYYTYTDGSTSDISGNDLLVVNGCTPGTYFKISGISDTIIVLL